MVYGGKPSTGCRTCRQRHIKCDETRPHCRACTRTKRSCPGYPDPFDLMLRDQTPSFRKPVEVRSSPTTSSRANSSKSSPNTHTAEKYNQTDSKAVVSAKIHPTKVIWPALPTPVDLYQPMEDTVVPIFFNSYLYLPRDQATRKGFMEILPVNFSNTKTGSHLHASTLAVAFFSVAAWTGKLPLLRAAEHYFTQALSKIREALVKNEHSDLDSVLLSTLLLSTYEEFVAMKDEEHPLKAHLRGAIALINDRKAKRLETPSSKTIDDAVQVQIIKTSRGLDSPMVPTPKVWPLSLPPAQPEPRTLLATAASDIVNLRHSWDQMIVQPLDEAVGTSILEQACNTDRNLATWSYLLPSDWAPVAASIIPQSVREAGMYKNRCDCYTDIWTATTWNTYRDCRILVQLIILGCLRMMPFHDLNGLRSTLALSIAHRLADDICASVPYCLGNQIESIRMKPGLVQYPFAETRPVAWTHHQVAPLMGPWLLAPYLRNLQSPELGLPLEQTSWVQSQIERILTIYFQR